MHESTINKICEDYSLGTPLLPLEKVHGGLIHRMWRLTTSLGTFALKELSRHAADRPEIRSEFIRAENISEFFSVHGISAVSALRLNDEVIYTEGNVSVVVYSWIQGTSQLEKSTYLAQIEQIGKLLAKLHVIGKEYKDIGDILPFSSSSEEWESIHQKVKGIDSEWGRSFIEQFSSIMSWNKQGETAFAFVSADLVVSHRDLNPQNILWDHQGSPHIIDWESAGAINPTLELFMNAIEWSMPEHGNVNVDESKFRAFVKGYCSVLGINETILEACFCFSVANLLDWLKFNIIKAIQNKSVEEYEMATQEISTSLKWLDTVPLQKQTFLHWIQETNSHSSTTS